MGDRTWWNEECPNCKGEVEVYDAPSSITWSKTCNDCPWTDREEYYEDKDGFNVHRLTIEEATKMRKQLYQKPHGLTKKELAQRLAQANSQVEPSKNAPQTPPKEEI